MPCLAQPAVKKQLAELAEEAAEAQRQLKLDFTQAALDAAGILDPTPISDGLSADLHHILEESHCGATLDADAIPIHPDAILRSQSSGRSPLEHALTDGEDFELIFAVPPEQIARIPSHCYQIGECTRTGYIIVEGTTRRELQPSGWVHPLPD